MKSPRALLLLGVWAVAACGTAADDNAPSDANLQLIKIAARRWTFAPDTIHLQQGVPVIFEITASDVHHGFVAPDLGAHADLFPGIPERVRINPSKTGTFYFHCDYYCGMGHEGMEGQVVVE